MDRSIERVGGTAAVHYICVLRAHYLHGLDKPDGSGHYTVYGRAWAYCAGGKPEETHVWQPTGGVSTEQLTHDRDWTSGDMA